MTKAVEVKASIDQLSEHLSKAAKYTDGYQGAPIYVQRGMQDMYFKIYKLLRQAKRLQAKCPDKFRFE